MRTFKDNQDREWALSINVGTIKAVRGLTGFDILSEKAVQQLAEDPVLLVDTIFCLCKKQADEKGISDEDFGAALVGDAIEAASTAFIEELVDFFPKAKRDVLSRLLGKIKQGEAMMLTKASEKIDALNIEDLLASGEASMNAPESSD